MKVCVIHDFADNICHFQMCSMDINPMSTLHQRDRRQLEVMRYPHLDGEIIRRDPAWCQHMSDCWQSLVLDPLIERLIPARTYRPVAFVAFGHWGPFAHVMQWRLLAIARFENEASMLSWLIASQHVEGNFLHSQSCVLALFCHNLRQSIPGLTSKRKRLLWDRLYQLLQCMICRETRFEWGVGTTRQYLELFIDHVSEYLDFSTFVISSNLRDLTLTQVLPMDLFCTNVRRTALDEQLRRLMPIEELVNL